MEVVTKGSDEEGKGNGRREMLKKSSGEGKEWWREVVTKGSGDEGDWWRREVATTGSGEWWQRDVVMKENGEKARCGRLEVVRKESSEEGKRAKGSYVGRTDDAYWWGREVVNWGGSRNLKLCVFLLKWRWKVPRLAAVAAGSFLSRIVLLCTWNEWCSSIRFLKLWLVDQIEMAARLFVICSCQVRG